jgi:hypothetical protein
MGQEGASGGLGTGGGGGGAAANPPLTPAASNWQSVRGGTGGGGTVLVAYSGNQRGIGGALVYTSGANTIHVFYNSGVYIG